MNFGNGTSLSRQPLLNFEDDHDENDGDSRISGTICETDDDVHGPNVNKHFWDVLSPSHYLRWNRNVTYNLVCSCILVASREIWARSALSGFVFLIKGREDMQYVGLVTATLGISQLIAAIPAGILADRYHRDVFLKVASGVGFLVVPITSTAVLLQNFVLLWISLALWGIFWGILNTSLPATFADSIIDGQRSYFFSLRDSLQKIGETVGPFVVLIMFLIVGDEWTMTECASIICLGQFLSIPALILLCFIKDGNLSPLWSTSDCNLQRGVDEEDHDVSDNHVGNDNHYATVVRSQDKSNDTTLTQLSTAFFSENEEIMLYDYEEVNVNLQGESAPIWFIPGKRVIPIFVVSGDILAGLASGLSMRYFTIFFLDDMKLNPSEVQLVFLVSNILIVLNTLVAQKLSVIIGRIQTTILFKWIGVSMLMAMAAAYSYGFPSVTVCIFYGFRTAFIQSTMALTKSVIMDAVPRHERAKWSSLDSVNMLGWSGSSLLGAFMVDMKGVLFTFLLSSVLQLVATIPLFFVCKTVGLERNVRQNN